MSGERHEFLDFAPDITREQWRELTGEEIEEQIAGEREEYDRW